MRGGTTSESTGAGLEGTSHDDNGEGSSSSSLSYVSEKPKMKSALKKTSRPTSPARMYFLFSYDCNSSSSHLVSSQKRTGCNRSVDILQKTCYQPADIRVCSHGLGQSWLIWQVLLQIVDAFNKQVKLRTCIKSMAFLAVYSNVNSQYRVKINHF